MYQLGAICYVAWGLLHLQAADRVRQLAARQPAGMAQGRLFQAAWNLAYLAVFVLWWPCGSTGATTRWATGSTC